jgi:hypothetical protein
VFDEPAADASASVVLGDHEFLNPGDRPVGEEGRMAVAEQVADDATLGGVRDEQQRFRVVYQLCPGGVECGALGSVRGGEGLGEGPDTLGASACRRLAGTVRALCSVWRCQCFTTSTIWRFIGGWALCSL